MVGLGPVSPTVISVTRSAGVCSVGMDTSGSDTTVCLPVRTVATSAATETDLWQLVLQMPPAVPRSVTQRRVTATGVGGIHGTGITVGLQEDTATQRPIPPKW